MKNRGIRNRVAVQDVLTIAQNNRRVNWCRRHLFVDFTKVIFSDETVISLRPGKKFGRIYVYRKAGQKFLPRYVTRTPQVLQRGSVTIWGCMSYWGLGCLETFIGTMDSQHYVEETLENYLRPSIGLLYPFGDCIFQQDNTPPNTARITKQGLANNDFPVLDWPPYSPDLNPIEHVWEHLKQKLYTSMPSTPQEVMNTFLSLWNELRTQYAESLVFPIYNRMDNIIQTNGLRH